MCFISGVEGMGRLRTAENHSTPPPFALWLPDVSFFLGAHMLDCVGNGPLQKVDDRCAIKSQWKNTEAEIAQVGLEPATSR